MLANCIETLPDKLEMHMTEATHQRQRNRTKQKKTWSTNVILVEACLENEFLNDFTMCCENKSL